MTKQYIDVSKAWGIVLCYDFDWRDADDMAALMEAFGCSDEKIRKSIRILMGTNTGMAISRGDLRMSVVFVGSASSEEQWWDTLTHELYHVQQSICTHYNVRPDSEDGAWTMGFLMRKAVKMVAHPCE